MSPETQPIENDTEPPIGRRRMALSPRRFLVVGLLLTAIYGYGLTRDVSEPWHGVHDWNGAFFSQLARNFLRYPWSVHHGMPIVAAGAATPGPEDSSIYATHPPALVWLVAGSFRIFGESEWAARLVPIVFSLMTFVLFLWLAARAYDMWIAMLAGLFYAVMPMSVYFGRMVDHEAVCLFCMMAAAVGWMQLNRGGGTRACRGIARYVWQAAIVASIWLCVWVDWSGVVFGGLLVGWMGVQALRKKSDWTAFAVVGVGAAIAVVSMVCFIVYAGLEGRWSDLAAIFFSRAAEHEDIAGAGIAGDWWRHIFNNLTWLLAILAIVGSSISVFGRRVAGVGDSIEARSAARVGLNLVALAAIVWVGVFWKQFERHEYWMFYIGPAVAISGAIAILTLVDIAWRARARFSVVALFVVAMAAAAIEVDWRNWMFGRIHQVDPRMIDDWRAVREMTAPTDRVLLYHDPFRVERRGGYVFRNIVPPHMAWYMDRAMGVERDVGNLPIDARSYAVFVIDSRSAARLHERDQQVFRGLPANALVGQVVFDMRPLSVSGAGADSEAKD